MNRRPISTARGFTLLETAVSVGILAVVTAAIAIVFQTVGETVATGKRLSSLTRRNAQIEQVMRRDFDAMVRDEGFLVIRNELAQSAWDGQFITGLDETALWQGEPQEERRRRRIDEIMFFSRGDFETARAPLHPSRRATASVARIYYGHGQKRPDDLSDLSVRPVLDDLNAVDGARLGEASGLFVNPNEFAKDWSVLRHVTLLIDDNDLNIDQPSSVFHLTGISTVDAGPSVNLANFNRVRDFSRQVALQPAAQSIFRSVALLRPDIPSEIPLGSPPHGIRPFAANSPRSNTVVARPLGGQWTLEVLAPPQYTSGIVDIATQSLSDVTAFAVAPRFVDEMGQTYLIRPTAETGTASATNGLLQRDYQGYNLSVPDFTGGFESFVEHIDPSGFPGPTRTVREGPIFYNDGFRRIGQVQQEWMLDALPTIPFRHDVPSRTGHRIRYEDDPPRLDALDLADVQANNETRLLDAIERADQEMLTSSVFLNACSEFIVEWSYGVIDDDPESPSFGQPIYYGLRRYEDLNDNDRFDPTGTTRDVLLADVLAETYGERPMVMRDGRTPGTRGFVMPSELSEPDPTTPMAERITDDVLQTVLMRRHSGAPQTTRGLYANPNALEAAPAMEYVFGPIDANTGDPINGDFPASGPTTDQVKPLPWPRLIRITARLVDPLDPEPDEETTFQAIFRLPRREGR